MDSLEEMLTLLRRILKDPSSRKVSVNLFLKCFFEKELDVKRSHGQAAAQILSDLAYDLNFFVADHVVRAEEPSYFGDKRLVEEVEVALRRLSKIGIAISHRHY